MPGRGSRKTACPFEAVLSERVRPGPETSTVAPASGFCPAPRTSILSSQQPVRGWPRADITARKQKQSAGLIIGATQVPAPNHRLYFGATPRSSAHTRSNPATVSASSAPRPNTPSTSSNCSIFDAPRITPSTGVWNSSQFIARSITDRPAAPANRPISSTASKYAGCQYRLRYIWLLSNRVPGAGRSRLSFPVSSPPASGLNTTVETPNSRQNGKYSCSIPRATMLYIGCDTYGTAYPRSLAIHSAWQCCQEA